MSTEREFITLRQRIDELIAQHGTLRATARVLMTDCGYLHRLRNGEKTEPGDDLLRRMGLREVTTYERTSSARALPAAGATAQPVACEHGVQHPHACPECAEDVQQETADEWLADEMRRRGARQSRMSDEMRDFIVGMSVSVDVSTGEADEHHRYFGTITEVMDDREDKHLVTLLVQDAKPNFAAPPAELKDALREAIARAIYDQWKPIAGWVPWTNGGNSLQQDKARRITDAAIAGSAK